MGLLTRLLGYYTVVVDATKELFMRILMGVLIFLGYVLLSLFIYAVMRRIMVPQKLHVVPVHLQYRSVLVHIARYLDFTMFLVCFLCNSSALGVVFKVAALPPASSLGLRLSLMEAKRLSVFSIPAVCCITLLLESWSIKSIFAEQVVVAIMYIPCFATCNGNLGQSWSSHSSYSMIQYSKYWHLVSMSLTFILHNVLALWPILLMS